MAFLHEVDAYEKDSFFSQEEVAIGFALQVHVNMFSTEAVGFLTIFFWKTLPVPSISSRRLLSASVVRVLVLPLLWAVFENDNNYLPVRQVSQLSDYENPVKKGMLLQ
jgi:hypothetical protein